MATKAGRSVPAQFEGLDALTPFGAVYRYEDYDSELTLDRSQTRAVLRSLRTWVEALLPRTDSPGTLVGRNAQRVGTAGAHRWV